MTQLRQMVLDELQRRNYAPITIKHYLRIIDEFARYLVSRSRSSDRTIFALTRHTCSVTANSLPETVRQHVAALRFVFVKTPKRAYMLEYIPFPKEERGLPLVLSQEEVARLIEASGSLMHRAMLMTLYAAGMRRTEAANLKVADMDSNRMVIHVREGKGRRDRDIPLSSKLLDVLREYWRWMKPKTYLFPGTIKGWRADVPISPKMMWARRWLVRHPVNWEYRIRDRAGTLGTAYRRSAPVRCGLRTRSSVPAQDPAGGWLVVRENTRARVPAILRRRHPVWI